ncbi:CDK-activating kinase assembly factor MAT1 [Desmophyllum pertusum]|uniref:CDK-activating kinase assembly factor MAT1 n=1 Tax=Desmophyllum pertusum TaxID=174260 RepID=A0A9W9YJA7_9CNID|nr:CDK-activating kinase assembly factor MAT1 [Desmophyllum pertusum]
MEKYKKDNESLIRKNNFKLGREDAMTKGDRPLDDIIAEHASKLQKKSLLFTANNSQLSSLQKETFAPLPSAEGPLFVYVAPEVINDGPAAPEMEVLAARGYLRHVRNATEGEKAGGYTSELACGRAIQEAFSALYLGDDL